MIGNVKFNKKLTIEPLLSSNEILRNRIQISISTELLEKETFISESFQGKALNVFILANNLIR